MDHPLGAPTVVDNVLCHEAEAVMNVHPAASSHNWQTLLRKYVHVMRAFSWHALTLHPDLC